MIGCFASACSRKSSALSFDLRKASLSRTTPMLVRSAVSGINQNQRSIARSLFVDFCAALSSVVQLQLIKITACDLISVIGLRTIAVLKVKLGSRFRARAEDFATELFHESGAQEFFVKPQSGKCFHAERQQRFANVKSRKSFAFEDNHAPPGACEKRCGSAARRSSPYDSDIVHCELHRVLIYQIVQILVRMPRSPESIRESPQRPAMTRPSDQFVLTCGPPDEADRSIY